MKTYKASDLTHNRAEVLREAEANGVIIQQCRTNGEVVSELVLMSVSKVKGMECCHSVDDYLGLKGDL